MANKKLVPDWSFATTSSEDDLDNVAWSETVLALRQLARELKNIAGEMEEDDDAMDAGELFSYAERAHDLLEPALAAMALLSRPAGSEG